jgi:hypothetical protein
MAGEAGGRFVDRQQEGHLVRIDRRHRRFDIARRNGHHLDAVRPHFQTQAFQIGDGGGLEAE